MSQENVELVHRLLDAWNHQDVEAILALSDPEAEYVNPTNALEPGTRRGHAEIVTVFRKQWEGIPGALHEIYRLHDRGDEIISEGRLSRTMPGSDTRISDTILMSWKFRDGKIVRLEQLGNGPNFPDALKAAGLSP
ncbi:MAG TPA: nuclear transport factor 2 family protein [Solirubrobacterales bacterium]|nr:nuclear transport factor 2 family protein [Solirubrobacterales bacterium]